MATLQIAANVPLCGKYYHVVHLPSYHDSIPEMLKRQLEKWAYWGFNHKGDGTRLSNDFNVRMKCHDAFDGMKLAQVVLGPKVAFDPASKWDLSSLSEHLFGKSVDKRLRTSDWEAGTDGSGHLSNEQVVYGAIDAAVTLASCLLLRALREAGADATKPLQWNGTVDTTRRTRQRVALGGLVHDDQQTYVLYSKLVALDTRNPHGEPAFRLLAYPSSLTACEPFMRPRPVAEEDGDDEDEGEDELVPWLYGSSFAGTPPRRATWSSSSSSSRASWRAASSAAKARRPSAARRACCRRAAGESSVSVSSDADVEGSSLTNRRGGRLVVGC